MPIDFDVSDAQRAFQDTVEAYLAHTCPPQKILSAFKDTSLSESVWRGACELGLPGVLTPVDYDGLGLGFLDAAVIAEAIGRFGAPSCLAEHWVATAALAGSAHHALKQKWLPALAAGAARASVCFAGGDERWTPAEWSLEPGKTLNAICPHTPWAGGADILLIGLAGGRLGIIEAVSGVVSAQPAHSLDATRPLAMLTIKNATLHVISEDSALAWRMFDLWATLLAADASGGASHCLNATVGYVKQRVQFGVPIGQFQGVKHQLADMALNTGPICGLYWYAAHALDTDMPDASRAAAQAKAHCTVAFVDAARKAIELHGGIGYTWEYGLHIWLRRSLYNRQYLGGPRKHRARVADLSGW